MTHPRRTLLRMLGTAERSWDTRGFAPGEQFALWQEMACEAFVPVSLSSDDAEDGFRSCCQSRTIGSVGMSWLASGAQVVERTCDLIGRGASGMYFVNLPLVGRGVACQDGRRAVAGPGDFVVVDADRPFELDFGGPFEQISLAVPHDLLRPLLAEPDDAMSRTVSGEHGVGAVASAAIRTLAAERSHLDARQTRGVITHLAGLIALGISSAVPPRDAGSRALLLQAALDEIERSLGDPDLSIDVVACRINISPSYLTKLFAGRDTTFGRWLLARRLDRAWDALDPSLVRLGHPTVTEVSSACGFRDSSHFARTFHRRFGITPTQRRAGTGGQPAITSGRE